VQTRQVQIPYRDGLVSVRQVRYKLYPNQAQLETLEQWNRLHCALYNACIEQRRRAWAKGKSLGYYDQQNQLPALKAELPEYTALGSHALQETVRRVDRAFQAFYRRLTFSPWLKPGDSFSLLASYAGAPVGTPPHTRGGRHRPNYWA